MTLIALARRRGDLSLTCFAPSLALIDRCLPKALQPRDRTCAFEQPRGRTEGLIGCRSAHIVSVSTKAAFIPCTRNISFRVAFL